MTKYFCDICQKELGIEDLVCINFNHFGVRDERDKEIQVCEDCSREAYKTVMLLSQKRLQCNSK